MFCPKCGNQVADGNAFCPSCGNNMSAAPAPAVQQQAYAPQPQQQAYAPQPQQYGGYAASQRSQVRTGELNEMRRMIDYFSKKTDQYNEYDRVNDELVYLSRGYSVKKMVWGIILAVIGFVQVIYSILQVAAYSRYGSNSGTTVAVVFLVLGIIILGLGGLLIFLHIRGRKAYLDRVAYANMRFDQLSEELIDYYNAYGYCPMGPEYTNPSNLAVIYDTIQSGRADTTMDAINILVEDAHRNNMEAIARQTAVNTAVAARGATAGAVFSAANFFLK